MTDNSRGILSLSIKDKPSLEAAYMPFVKNGGIFVPLRKFTSWARMFSCS